MLGAVGGKISGHLVQAVATQRKWLGGAKGNVRLDNLACLSRRGEDEHVCMNRLYNYVCVHDYCYI